MDTTNAPGTEITTMPHKAKWAAVAVLAIVIVGAAGWTLAGTKLSGKVLGANTSYQAVFLTNGQVYFGKMTDNGNWIQLTDIYYLQVTQPLQQTANADQSKTATPSSTTGSAATPQSNIQLVKLGSELHGPQDSMYIERDKILFWENMKDDSKVVAAIHQFKSK
jgi:hypothetical protein